MKRKRSGIKVDSSPSTMSTKPVDAIQESKQGMHERLVTGTRSKLSNDSHAFRATACDEFNSASPTSSTKMNTNIRAPRSGSGVGPKLLPVAHRTAVPNDWELSQCINKPTAGVSTDNRKCVGSAQSSSPPVTHWAEQRPQKSSCTARRTNFMPIVFVSNANDSLALDAVSDVADDDLGLGFPRRLAGSSPQQIKLKGDPLSSAVLSESEESGPADIKLKDKGKKPDEIDQIAGQNVQKVCNLAQSSRKNKLVSAEEHGDGVQRQGRTGRRFTSTRSLLPVASEKLPNVGTAKRLRSARLVFEKNESKAGCPPTRKLSDRKAYTRQNHAAIAAADFLVGSDDGHEELLAAVKGVIKSSCAFFSCPFWWQMEPFFGLITEEDITNLKQKAFESSAPMSTLIPSNVDGCDTIINGFGLIGHKKDSGPGVEKSTGINPEQLLPAKGYHNVIPLCQRIIVALISEEYCSGQTEDLKFDAYGTEAEQDADLALNSLNHHPRANVQFACHSAYNGYTQSDRIGFPTAGLDSSFGNSVHDLLEDKALLPSLTYSELQCDSLSMNYRLLLELQSIGIFLEPVPDMLQSDDEGICEDIINKLEENYPAQISKKKGLLDVLLKSASVTKELQEKDFEQRALDKLLVMAYEKHMACSGGESSSNKMAKQAALAFVKQTLERCHQFEGTGKSCFSEPKFKAMFLAASSPLCIAWREDSIEGEFSNQDAASLPMEGKTGSLGSYQGPSQVCQNVDNHDLSSSDVLPTINSSEQSGGKEDFWSSRMKKRELSFYDVVGTMGNSTSSGIGNSLLRTAKGKRSERDRDGKGHSREVLSRNGTTKLGRPALSSAKGERKSNSKPKQKATQHSVSVNGLIGKLSELPKSVLPSVSKSHEISTNMNAKEKDEFGLEGLDGPESIDLSNLQLLGMDILGVPDDFGGQGQDLASWLNIDDDGLQDDDFMGLEIPMDDLADLNMMV